MFISLSTRERDALAYVALCMFGTRYGGRIRTNEPDIHSVFVDFFNVYTQEDILPVFQRLMQLNQSDATRIITNSSWEVKNEFRSYMLDRARGDGRVTLAVACFMQNVGFDPYQTTEKSLWQKISSLFK